VNWQSVILVYVLILVSWTTIAVLLGLAIGWAR